MKQLFIGSDSFFLAQQDHELEKLFIEQTFVKDVDKKICFLKDQDCYITVLKKNAQSSIKFTNFSKQDLSIKKYETITTTKTIDFGTYTARAGVAADMIDSFDSSKNEYYREVYWCPMADKRAIFFSADNENIKELKEILNWPKPEKYILHGNASTSCYAIKFDVHLKEEWGRNKITEPFTSNEQTIFSTGSIKSISYTGGWVYTEVSRGGNYGKYQRVKNLPTPGYEFYLTVSICKGSFSNSGPGAIYNAEVIPESEAGIIRGPINGNNYESFFSLYGSIGSRYEVGLWAPAAFDDFTVLYNKGIGRACITSWRESITNNPDEFTIYYYSPSFQNVSKTISIQANLKYKIEPARNVVKESISVPSEVFKIR